MITKFTASKRGKILVIETIDKSMIGTKISKPIVAKK